MSNIPDEFPLSFIEESFDSHLRPNDDKGFQEFDFSSVKHAENIQSSSNIRHLVYKLTAQCDTVMQKVASIFYWLSFIDKSSIEYHNPTNNSLESNFNLCFNWICWQPRVFEFLCRCIEVPCVTINGVARTIENIPQITKDMKSNHYWNGVCIEKTWFLCDIIWSLKLVTKYYANSITSTNFQEKALFTNKYFLAPPIYFLTTHFPRQGKYQFLSDTISFDQFLSYPIFTAHFHDSPLANLPYDRYEMVSENGYFKLVLPCFHDSLFFHFLEYYDEDKKQLILKCQSNENIKSYSLIEVAGENLILYFRFPWKGNYYLTICSQNETNSLQSPAVFNALLKWKIHCKSTDDKIAKFYGCQDMSIGPSWPHMRYYGLVPVNLTTGIINMEYSPPAYIEACFTKLNADVNVIAKVRGSTTLLPTCYVPDTENDITTSHCNGECLDWLIDEEDDSESEITFTIRLPRYGEYSLEIYANLPKEGDTFVQVAQYMLDLKQYQTDQISAIH